MDNPPRIEFPCNYPVKVIVQSEPDILSRIAAVVADHDAMFSIEKMTQNPSRNGRFVSLRFDLWATGEPQLQALFADLKQCKAVRMVL